MKKWIVRIALFTLVGLVLTFIFVNRELTRMYGGLTTVAEVSLETAHERIAITNVNVLRPDASGFDVGQTVLIDDGIIVAIGDRPDIPDDSYRVDGDGLYLVPGFTDSHVHLWQSENDLLLYLANGVTQVREMNGSEDHLTWKREIEAGRLGPDLFVVAPQLAEFSLIKGLFIAWTQSKTLVRSPEEVEEKVKALKAEGYDAIKASSFLSPELFAAVGEASQRRRIPLVGHLTNTVDIDALLASPQSELAHIEEIHKALDRGFGEYTPDNTDEFLAFVAKRSDEVAVQLKATDKTVTTTLALVESFPKQKSDLDTVLTSAALKYANPGITEGTIITSRGLGWLPEVNLYRWNEGRSDDSKRRSLRYWETYAESHRIILQALVEADVPVLAGTDANVPVTVPGFSLHEELIALNEAGMNTTQVLASATTAPAKWSGEKVGEVYPGFRANLVLLRDNPLQDIRATSSIETVIKGTHVLDREDLDTLLQAVLRANDDSRSESISRYEAGK